MSTVSGRMVHTTRFEFSIPGAMLGGMGAPIGELERCIRAAERKYKEVHGEEPTCEDSLRVYVNEEEVIIFFEKEGIL